MHRKDENSNDSNTDDVDGLCYEDDVYLPIDACRVKEYAGDDDDDIPLYHTSPIEPQSRGIHHASRLYSILVRALSGFGLADIKSPNPHAKIDIDGAVVDDDDETFTKFS